MEKRKNKSSLNNWKFDFFAVIGGKYEKYSICGKDYPLQRVEEGDVVEISVMK